MGKQEIKSKEVWKEKFKHWLIFNLKMTSRSNVEQIIDHVERYFPPESDAVEFVEWIGIGFNRNEDRWISKFNDGSHGKSHITPAFYTTEQLYKLFKEQHHGK